MAWEGNKAQAAALESVMIEGANRILRCSSKTCNEAVRGDRAGASVFKEVFCAGVECQAT